MLKVLWLTWTMVFSVGVTETPNQYLISWFPQLISKLGSFTSPLLNPLPSLFAELGEAQASKKSELGEASASSKSEVMIQYITFGMPMKHFLITKKRERTNEIDLPISFPIEWSNYWPLESGLPCDMSPDVDRFQPAHVEAGFSSYFSKRSC